MKVGCFSLAALWRPVVLGVGSVVMGLLTAPVAHPWDDVAVISSTLGNNAGRLCLGAGGSDLGCPTSAPFVTTGGLVGLGSVAPQTRLDVSGTLRVANGNEDCDANRAGGIRYTSGNFEFCDGSTGWQTLSQLAASGGAIDRVVSGTSAVIAQQGGTVSFTLGGTSGAAYLHPSLGLVASGVSTTGRISGTEGYFQRLGINTAAGSYALAVDGNVWFPNANSYMITSRDAAFVVESSDHTRGFGFNNGHPAIFSTGQIAALTVSENRVLIGGGGAGAPTTALQVSGTLRVANGNEDCDANRAGGIRYNAGVFEFCSGSAWQSLGDIASSSSDRITSGTTNVLARADGSISFTTAGVTTGYFYNGQLVAQAVSTTGIGRFANVSSTGNVSGIRAIFSELEGTLQTAAQPSVTSLGDLTGLTVTGNSVLAAISATDISASGTISANAFIGDGSGLTNLNAGAISGLATDRISSTNNQAMVVATEAGTVSFTLGGTAGAAYLHPSLGLVAPGISTTGIGRFANVSSTGNVSGIRAIFSELEGTLQTAAQPSVTSLGDLTGLTVTGNSVLAAISATDISASGTVSANAFVGDGSGLTNLNAGAIAGLATDRISSTNNQAMVVATGGGTVSFTLGGTPGAAYLHPTLGLVASGVSVTGASSATQIYVANQLAFGDPLSLTSPQATIFKTVQNGTDYGLEVVSQWDEGGLNIPWELLRIYRNNIGLNGRLLLTNAPGISLSSLDHASTTLHVSGTLRLANGGEACDANRAGGIRYNTGSFEFCDGTSGWRTLSQVAATGGAIDRIVSGSTVAVANGTDNVVDVSGTLRVAQAAVSAGCDGAEDVGKMSRDPVTGAFRICQQY